MNTSIHHSEEICKRILKNNHGFRMRKSENML